MNVINEAGVLALSTRLQRLSDQLRRDGALIYKSFDIEFEPKWFPIIFVLAQKEFLSVVQIAGEIGYTHPSTISMLKELEKKGLVTSKKDKLDERRRLVLLTTKGIGLVGQIQPVWELISSVLEEISDNGNHLLKAIEEVEAKINDQTFYQRALKQKNSK
ncbi:MarR family winged helix-turn-helix transcriptional regulator [Epilithonimonas lactis]|uniref:MarR family transcriptional regulator n=1 Tax=Epilithonimonas lactis TaxID=421072 RepID=A0A085BGD0_9FLAO|nr:MarR family winged helix-turn-helix transcriptional regulator [Epilithonimonas lactis]KFC21525.1 MarR family transcriptional regulator [Epilithonimonas lactis]SEP87907.1 DNA-binding transcriptional regulator, MarR family [Epilithonimonas lactis]